MRANYWLERYCTGRDDLLTFSITGRCFGNDLR